MVTPVPHHVVSSPSNSIYCPMNHILLWSNKWQHQGLLITLQLVFFLPLWALCCFLFSLMFSPEGDLCNNNRGHDKREHMQPYSSQRITKLPWTHCLADWRDQGEWTMSRIGGVVRGLPCVCLQQCFSSRSALMKSQGEKMENWGRQWRKRRREFWVPLLSSENDAILGSVTPHVAQCGESH